MLFVLIQFEWKSSHSFSTSERSTDVGNLDLLQDTTEVKKPEAAEEDEEQQKRKEDEEEEALKLEEPLVKLVRYDSSVPNALDNLLPEWVLSLSWYSIDFIRIWCKKSVERWS